MTPKKNLHVVYLQIKFEQTVPCQPRVVIGHILRLNKLKTAACIETLCRFAGAEDVQAHSLFMFGFCKVYNVSHNYLANPSSLQSRTHGKSVRNKGLVRFSIF